MKIVFSALLSAISGKVGSTVFAPRQGHSAYHTRKVQEYNKGPKPPAEQCSCWAWQFCDLTYQAMSDEDKLAWRNALKKRHMSGYDLWMKECLPLVNQGKNPPDSPSISGGFSSTTAVPGIRYPLPDGNPCQPPPPIPEGEECDNCEGDTPLYFSCVISGLTGEPEVYNAERILTQVDGHPCQWHLLHEGSDYYLVRTNPTCWDFLLEGAAPVGNAYFQETGANPDCETGGLLPWTHGKPQWGPQTDAQVDLQPSQAPP